MDHSQAVAFDAGFLVGLLVGEGHFGGDGKQPQVTLRMHTDHEAVFRWLMTHVPGGRLYGPYDHGGRRYYQWMARGSFLRDSLVPLLDHYFRPEHSGRAHQRYQAMKERYALALGPKRLTGRGTGRRTDARNADRASGAAG